MTALRRRGPPVAPIRTTNPIARAVMEAVDASGFTRAYVAKRAGVPMTCLQALASGKSSGTGATLSYILEAIGADVVLVDRNEPPPAPVRLLSLNAIRRAVGRG